MSLALFLSHDNWAVIWMTMGILQSITQTFLMQII